MDLSRGEFCAPRRRCALCASHPCRTTLKRSGSCRLPDPHSSAHHPSEVSISRFALHSHNFTTMTEQERLDQLAHHYHEILRLLGEDPQREGLLKTPTRVAKAMTTLTSGQNMDPIAVLNSAKFTEEQRQMVLVRDIEFHSLCEHHMLPFYGKVHVAYLPDGFICGLSKIPRVVDIFSHRLQVQERLTHQILEAVQTALAPRGVMVMIEAHHMCMQMRGVEKQCSRTVTTAQCGEFERPELRDEFLQLVRS